MSDDDDDDDDILVVFTVSFVSCISYKLVGRARRVTRFRLNFFGKMTCQVGLSTSHPMTGDTPHLVAHFQSQDGLVGAGGVNLIQKMSTQKFQQALMISI